MLRSTEVHPVFFWFVHLLLFQHSTCNQENLLSGQPRGSHLIMPAAALLCQLLPAHALRVRRTRSASSTSAPLPPTLQNLADTCVHTNTHRLLTSTGHVPAAASCSCPLPACPAPFACVQPRRRYLHFAKHECTQIFAGRVQPYPHIGTRCRRLQLHLALTTRASMQPPSTPRPPPRVPPTPPPTPLGTRTHTHKHSQATYVYRTCSRVLQLPFACLSRTLRVRTAASPVPPLC